MHTSEHRIIARTEPSALATIHGAPVAVGVLDGRSDLIAASALFSECVFANGQPGELKLSPAVKDAVATAIWERKVSFAHGVNVGDGDSDSKFDIAVHPWRLSGDMGAGLFVTAKDAESALGARPASSVADLETPTAEDGVLDAVDVGLVTMKADGTLELLNREARRILATEHRAMSLVRWMATYSLLDDADTAVSANESPIWRCLRNEAVGEATYRLQSIDRRVDRWVAVKVVRLQSNASRPPKMLLKLRDVSDQNDTRRILDDVLHAGVHDLLESLRTTTAGIQITGEAAAEHMTASEQQFLRRAGLASARLREQIEALSFYGRTYTSALQNQRVDLQQLGEQVLDQFRFEIGRRKATVTGALFGQVSSDAAALRKILSALVSNALKFTPDHQAPRVELSCERRTNAYRISIKDSGIGIPPSDQQRIFEAFRRLHPRSRFAGIGMGLTMCKRLVELHGGEIGLDSRPGEGAVFWFTVPAPVSAPCEDQVTD